MGVHSLRSLRSASQWQRYGMEPQVSYKHYSYKNPFLPVTLRLLASFPEAKRNTQRVQVNEKGVKFEVKI
jgi:hypothetical protein